MKSDWKRGDWVSHGGRPEWGSGQVVSAEGITQDGRKCQRLSVRFDRAGLKTLSTAFADLRPSTPNAPQSVLSEAKPFDPATLHEPDPPRADLEELRKALTTLPEECTDPFLSLGRRYENTLALSRFTGHGGSLLDWASTRTGMRDPLSCFSRHELEAFYAQFRMAAEAHLRKLSPEIRKKDPAVAAQIEAKLASPARTMLQRSLGGR